MTKKITILNQVFQYETDFELKKFIKKFPKFIAGYNFKVGDYFKAGDDFTITNHIIIPNNYKYISRCYFEINSQTWYIQLGCDLRTLADWENDFWNNDCEFPNDKSEESQKRFELFGLYKKIINII